MLTLKIKTDNEAFAEDFEGEIARILAVAITKIEHCNTEGDLFDVNGNKVGSFKLTGKRREAEEDNTGWYQQGLRSKTA